MSEGGQFNNNDSLKLTLYNAKIAKKELKSVQKSYYATEQALAIGTET